MYLSTKLVRHRVMICELQRVKLRQIRAEESGDLESWFCRLISCMLIRCRDCFSGPPSVKRRKRMIIIIIMTKNRISPLYLGLFFLLLQRACG